MSGRLKGNFPKVTSTPNNLNVPAAVGGPSTGKLRRAAGTPNNNLLNHQSSLNDTTVGRPRIRLNLGTTSTAPATDYELEYDFAYNEYLQALVKREITLKTIEKHKQDMNDQLAIQNDNLHKMKSAYQSIEEDLAKFEKLSEIEEMLTVLQSNIDTFKELCVRYNIQDYLENFITILNSACNRLPVKNIKPITTQEDYNRLMELIKKCMTATENIKLSNRDFDGVHKLANCLKTFEKLQSEFQEKHKALTDLQSESTYLFLKNSSDMFAAKHNID